MAKWVCIGCNYRFEAEDSNECPYCGRTDKLEKEPSASELLEEVEQLFER